MPIIIATSFRQDSLGEISFVDAGNDVIAVCDPGGTLTATVVGDLVGHSIIWEQLSGSPATFTSPVNELQVSYTVTEFDDKLFRFTVDKGLPTEVFDEVFVFGAPTVSAHIGGAMAERASDLTFGTTTRFGDIAELQLTQQLRPTFDSEPLIDCNVIENGQLVWDLPPLDSNLIHFEIQYRQGSTDWLVEATVTPEVRTHLPAVIEATYRIVAVFQTSNDLYTSSSNTVFNSTTPQPLAFVTEATQLPSDGFQAKTNSLVMFNVDQLSLVVKPTEVDDASIGSTFSQKTNSLVTFNVDQLSLVMKPTELDQASIGSTFSQKTNTLVSFDVTQLTAGDIGG